MYTYYSVPAVVPATPQSVLVMWIIGRQAYYSVCHAHIGWHGKKTETEFALHEFRRQALSRGTEVESYCTLHNQRLSTCSVLGAYEGNGKSFLIKYNILFCALSLSLPPSPLLRAGICVCNENKKACVRDARLKKAYLFLKWKMWFENIITLTSWLLTIFAFAAPIWVMTFGQNINISKCNHFKSFWMPCTRQTEQLSIEMFQQWKLCLQIQFIFNLRYFNSNFSLSLRLSPLSRKMKMNGKMDSTIPQQK